MEQPANASPDDAPQSPDASIPAAGQTAAHTLPACAVAVIGIPLMSWFLPRDPAEQRAPWELLIVFAALGLLAIIHRLVRTPRPRLDKEVGRAQWKRALSSAAKSGSLPSNPDVRTAAGVIACNIIEGFMMLVAVLLGTLLGALLRPELSWLVASSGLLGVAIVYAFRLRSSWSYLSVLHAKARAS